MSRSLIAILAVAVAACILVAGCTSSAPKAPAAAPVPAAEQTEAATPAPTTAAPAATTAAVLTSEPVQSLPAPQQISISLTKDRPTSEIHLLYEGGPGLTYTSKITMRVYSSPTEFKEYVMNDGKKKPAIGDEIVAQGTSGSDRCEVFVVSSGVPYKIMDQQVAAMR